MKTFVRALNMHQKVWALVEEILNPSTVIVSLGGDLMRVQNRSRRALRVGQRIQLQVTGVSPLEFKLIEARTHYSHRIDVEI